MGLIRRRFRPSGHNTAKGRRQGMILATALLLAVCSTNSGAQTRVIDSLKQRLGAMVTEDSTMVNVLTALAAEYRYRDLQLSMSTYRRATNIASRIGFWKGYGVAVGGIGFCYTDMAQYDSAHVYIEERRRIGERLRDTLLLAQAANAAGYLHTQMRDTESAIVQYQRALNFHKAAGDESGYAAAQLNLGLTFFNSRRNAEAMKHWRIALEIFDRRNELRPLASTLLNIGLVAIDTAQAVTYYVRALQLFEKLGDRRGIAMVALNLGPLYRSLGRISESINILTRGMEDAEIAGAEFALSGICGNLGWSYWELGDTVRAEALFQRCLTIAERRRDDYWTALALLGLASLKHCDGDPGLALRYTQRALKAASHCGARDKVLDAYGKLHKLHRCMGEIDEAYHYLKLWAELKDSLLNQQTTKTITEITTRYDAEKKDAQIRELEQDRRIREFELTRQKDELLKQSLLSAQRNQKIALLAAERDVQRLEAARSGAELNAQRAETERKRNEVSVLRKDAELQASISSREKIIRNGVLSGVVVLGLVAFLSIRRLRDRRREAALRAEAAEYKARAAEAQTLAVLAQTAEREREAQQRFSRQLLDSQETERKRIAGDLHDSVGQELLVMKNQLLLVLEDPMLSEKTRVRLSRATDVAGTALTDVRRISRNLRPVQLERSGLTDTLRDMVSHVAEGSAIRFETDIDSIDGIFRPDEQINVYRIVQEALNNVLKHSGARSARVSISRTDTRVRIVVRDDGAGFDPAALRDSPAGRHGIGLAGMEERVRMLEGALDIESQSGSGTRLTVELPFRPRESESRSADGGSAEANVISAVKNA